MNKKCVKLISFFTICLGGILFTGCNKKVTGLYIETKDERERFSIDKTSEWVKKENIFDNWDCSIFTQDWDGEGYYSISCSKFGPLVGNPFEAHMEFTANCNNDLKKRDGRFQLGRGIKYKEFNVFCKH